MNASIQALNDYLAAHCMNFGEKEVPSLLDFLVEQYTVENFINTDAVKESFRRLRPVLDALPGEQGDTLFYAVSDLCMETERRAYLEGIRLGARLYGELSSEI